jgi:hypothetical protein
MKEQTNFKELLLKFGLDLQFSDLMMEAAYYTESSTNL